MENKNKEIVTKQKNKEDVVAKEQENIMNKLKDKAIEKGVIKKSPKIKIVSKNFCKKTLKNSKGFYKNGKQHTLKAGTKWEDVDAFFRKNINFKIEDFNK